MPTPTRGKVHWYDFGPIVGSELSDERPALIISNSALNHTTTVAIAAPLSTTPPSTRHLRNHVFIEDAASWASVRQIKTVSQQELGDGDRHGNSSRTGKRTGNPRRTVLQKPRLRGNPANGLRRGNHHTRGRLGGRNSAKSTDKPTPVSCSSSTTTLPTRWQLRPTWISVTGKSPPFPNPSY